MREPLPSDFEVALERAASRLGPFTGRVLYQSEVSSTNDVAARLAASGTPEGTTVIAGTQTAGRGRHGRSWCSPADAGLYVSVLFRSCRASHLRFLTLMGGVAVADGIRSSTSLPVLVKWPNDVVIEELAAPRANQRRRKVAGILAEASGVGTAVEYVILGFGVNLRRVAFPPELARMATSIEVELGRPADRAAVLVESLAALAQWYAHLLAGRIGTILARWLALSPSSRGARVELEGPDALRQGITEGIDEQGALLVRVGSRVERLISGEVRWLE